MINNSLPSDQEYVENGGTSCPYCGSQDITTFGPIEAEGGCAWQDITCNNCNNDWVDNYSLTGYTPSRDSHRGNSDGFCAKCNGVCRYDSDGWLKPLDK